MFQLPALDYDVFKSAGAYNVTITLQNNVLRSDTSPFADLTVARTHIPFVVLNLSSRVIVLSFLFDKSKVHQTTDTAEMITFPGSMSVCPSLLGISIVLTVSAQQTGAGSDAAKTAASIASIISVVTMSPSAASTTAKMSALQDISACIFTNSDVPLQFSDGSFTSLTVGSSSGMYLRGAVIGNSSVVLVGGCVLFIIMFIWVWIENLKLPVQDKRDGVILRLQEACEIGRIPSIFYPVYLVFAPVTASFAVTLMFLQPALPENYAVALATLVVALAFPSYVTISLQKNFPCYLVPAPRPPRTPQFEWLMWLRYPFVKWVCSPLDTPWWRRNRLYFDDFNRWWFGLIDLWTMLLVGVINGVQVNSRTVCIAQLAAMLCILLAVFVSTWLLNPAVNLSLRWYQNSSNFLSLLACVIMITAIRLDNVFLLNVSSWIVLTVNCISLIKLLIDLIYVIYRFIRSFDLSRPMEVPDELLVLPPPIPAQETMLPRQRPRSNTLNSTASPPSIELESVDNELIGMLEELDLVPGIPAAPGDLPEDVLRPTEMAKRRADGDFAVFGFDDPFDGVGIFGHVLPRSRSLSSDASSTKTSTHRLKLESDDDDDFEL